MIRGGYHMRQLVVDLSAGKVHIREIPEVLVDLFLGGYGLNAVYSHACIPVGVDPLGPENSVIISAGPFVGTTAPSSGKAVLTTKLPTTGTVGNCTCGGQWGAQLKWAGFDSLVLVGRSDEPVLLKVDDEGAEIVPAQDLWGMDIYAATDAIWEKFGPEYSAYVIGPAGENGVPISLGLVDKVSTWGKGGAGAVLGSKKVKAIIVKGAGGVRVAEKKAFFELTRGLLRKFKETPLRSAWVGLGTMDGFDSWVHVTGFPHRNYSCTFPVDLAYERWSPERYVRSHKGLRLACSGCPVACKDALLRTGDGAVVSYVSSFYGRIMNWGSRCDVGSMDNVIRCQDYANRMGVCVHSVTAIIDWFVDCCQGGSIDESTLKQYGLLRHDVRWGYDFTTRILQQIVKREGVGEILGKGLKHAAEFFGEAAKARAVHLKGVEPLYDPRLTRLNTPDFSQLTNFRAEAPTAAAVSYCQLSRPIEEFKRWCHKVGVPPDAQARIFAKPYEFNVGRMTRYAQDWWALCNSLGINCVRGRVDALYNLEMLSRLYEALTGLTKSGAELMEAGERAFNTLKLRNVSEGFGREQDSPPRRWFEPMKVHGQVRHLTDYYGNALSPEDLDRLLEDYYDERGWDRNTGVPEKRKLDGLGIDIEGLLRPTNKEDSR